MKKLEQEIWLSAIRLHQMYADKDLEHNAHEIFHLAFDACRMLIWQFNHPLAYRLAMTLVHYYIERWESSHIEYGNPTNDRGRLQDVVSGMIPWTDTLNYS